MAATEAALKRRYLERRRSGSQTDHITRQQVLQDLKHVHELMTQLGDLRNDTLLDCNSETTYYFKFASLLLHELGCTHEAYAMGIYVAHTMGRRFTSSLPVCARPTVPHSQTFKVGPYSHRRKRTA